jgi:hypothetical protein
MKSIPDHVLKNAIVIVPRKRGLKGIVDLNSALLGVLGAVVAVGCVFLTMVAPYLSPASVTLPTWFYIVFGCIPGLALVSFGGWLALRKSGLDVILGRDTLKEEVIIAERRFSRPRKVIQIALAQVQAIRIYWLAVSSGNPDVGWWSAQLVLLDGKGIPLSSIKGKPAAPPDRWLARFKRVSTLLDKPLEILPSYADTQQTAYTPVVDQLINNIRQQSGSPDKPPKVFPHSTSARQTTYMPPAATEERPTVLGNIRKQYKEDEIFRFQTNFLLWMCCFLAVNAFTGMVGYNYWLHLLGESVTAFLITLAPITLLFVTLDGLKSQRDHKLAYVALYIVFCLICLAIVAVLILTIVDSSYDLYYGPIYAKGTIESTGSVNLRGYVIVHSTRYEIPSRSWFKTMEPGQEIEFLYGPSTTT